MKSTSRPVKKKRSGSTATYWLVGIVAVMVALALIVMVGQNQAGVQGAKTFGNTLGNANAPVTLEVYADFQCPACGQFDRQTLPQIIDKYVNTGKVKVVFNHFAFIGDESTRAAEASECANDQGKFWDFASLLYNNQAGENQGAFSDANLAKFAQQLGLDMAKYNQCMTSHLHLAKIQSSTQNGTIRGVSSTPTLFINNQPARGAISIQTFDALVAPLLKQ